MSEEFGYDPSAFTEFSEFCTILSRFSDDQLRKMMYRHAGLMDPATFRTDPLSFCIHQTMHYILYTELANRIVEVQ